MGIGISLEPEFQNTVMEIEAQQCNAVTLLYPERVMRPGTHKAGHKSRFGGNKLERARTFGRTPKIEIDMQIINSTNIADEIQ